MVYEDDHLVGVNKPSGLTTTASRSDTRRSLLDVVLDHVRSNADASMRVRPVNHLDRRVSGVVVFAKSKRMESALESLFRRNRVRRTYSAVVEGAFDDAPGTTGTVQSPDAPSPKGRRDRNARDSEPRTPAITHYRVVGKSNGRSLVQLRPETHRRDQLTDHMRQIEHPIVSHPSSPSRRDAAPPRLMLHLEQIAFEHPRTGRDVRIVAPRPSEFDRMVTDGSAAKETAPDNATSTSWERVAEWYGSYQAAGTSDHFSEVIHPGTLELIGSVDGKRVLDVACGEGAFAARLAEVGAAVTGVDAAEALIAQANARAIPRARFVAGDASRLDEISHEVAGPFDAAVSMMALMNIADLDATCRGISARLASGAPFVAVILHPAFRAPKRSAWGWDEQAGSAPKQYRRVDAYLSEATERITMNPGAVAHGADPVVTYTFHRPISAYIHSLTRAGFMVNALTEWASARTSEPGPRAAEENRARAEIPLFLGIRAIRSPRTHT